MDDAQRRVKYPGKIGAILGETIAWLKKNTANVLVSEPTQNTVSGTHFPSIWRELYMTSPSLFQMLYNYFSRAPTFLSKPLVLNTIKTAKGTKPFGGGALSYFQA